MFDIPIALIIFNRPNLTRLLIDRIRPIQPRRLFVIADGPRQNRDNESEKVSLTRRLIERIDWPCDLTRLYASENLGCGYRIRSGINQVFQSVDQLIILEDDCMPNQSFFRYCKSLLRRYQNEPRVMSIAGTSFHRNTPQEASYYFSRYAHCWGWATWRRAWQLYDTSFSDWRRLSTSDRFAKLFDSPHQRAFWTHNLDRVSQGRADTWDVQWMLTCWLNGGLSAIPRQNLVSNIGFGEDATHTHKQSDLDSLPTFELDALVHPDCVRRDFAADAYSDQILFSGTWKHPGIYKSTTNRLKRLFCKPNSLLPQLKAA